MIRVSRRERAAVAIWAGLAVVAWNWIYDVRISLGIREYLLDAALYQAGRGPAVTISEAMRATVADAVRVASLWAAVIAAAGVATFGLLRPRA